MGMRVLDEPNESSDTFVRYACEIIPVSGLFALWERFGIHPKFYPNSPNQRFFRPIEGFRNHLIWRGKAHGDKVIRGRNLGVEIESAINGENGDEIFLFCTDLHPNGEIPMSVKCKGYSEDLAIKYLDWIHLAQSFVALNATRRILFYLEDELEFCMLCRDASISPNPTPNLTDADLIKCFVSDFHKWREFPPRDDYKARHFINELIDHTEERNFKDIFLSR